MEDLYFIKFRSVGDHLVDCYIHFHPDKGYLIGQGLVGACGFKKKVGETMVRDIRKDHNGNTCYLKKVESGYIGKTEKNEKDWLQSHRDVYDRK